MSDENTEAPLGKDKTGTLEHAAKRLLNEPSNEAPLVEEPEQAAEPETEESTEVEEVVSEDSQEESPEEFEEVEEAEVEEPESEEEELAYYSVKVDGEEMEVTLDELQSGYQRQKDYTKKTQTLAEQRKSYEEKTAELEQLHQAFTHQATLANELLNRDLKKFESVDWEQLKADDPNGYVLKQIEVQDIRTKQAELQQHAQRAYEHNQQVQNQALAQELEVQRKETLKLFPEWKDADKAAKGQQEMIAYAQGIGFTPEELGSIVKARDLMLINKAMKFDALQETKKGISKKKVAPAIRKTVKKKGLAPKSASKIKSVADKKSKLRKSGSLKDAAALMMEMQSNKAVNKTRG
jgi:hypothetical protein